MTARLHCHDCDRTVRMKEFRGWKAHTWHRPSRPSEQYCCKARVDGHTRLAIAITGPGARCLGLNPAHPFTSCVSVTNNLSSLGFRLLVYKMGI